MAEAATLVNFLMVLAIVALIIPIVALAYGWNYLNNYLEKRRIRRMQGLIAYHGRLLTVINYLLARADRIDQNAKFVEAALSDDWARDMAKTCNKLVVLTDSSKLIEGSLKSQDLKQAEEYLLTCVKVAQHLMLKLNTLERTLGNSESTTFRVKSKQQENL